MAAFGAAAVAAAQRQASPEVEPTGIAGAAPSVAVRQPTKQPRLETAAVADGKSQWCYVLLATNQACGGNHKRLEHMEATHVHAVRTELHVFHTSTNTP